ncbi:MAB_1171c family putative transporter [Amycolatopsis sp. NPDC004625]|uniref:MAB_1171c family putative transporter n=1 Tax=Amycolatopsis sp. NPDC004625 TaxID=3154670 RepID=UPI0033BF204D
MNLPGTTVVAAVVTTAAWLYFLRALLRKPRNDTLLCAWLSAQFMAFALYLGLVEYGAEVTRPIPAWARTTVIAQHVCVPVALCLGHLAYIFLICERKDAVRQVVRHAWLLTATLTTMLALALLADPAQFTAAHVAHYSDSGLAGAYMAVFTAYAGIIVTATARVTWTWSRLVDDPWIRRGLVAGTIGLLLGVLYFLVGAAFIALAVVGHPIALNEGALVRWLLVIAVPLSLAGLTTPGWGPRLASARTWWRSYRAYRRLHPLWAELTGAFPHVRLAIQPSRASAYLRSRFPRPGWVTAALDNWDERWSPLHRHLDLRLHLRVLQIWDARRALLDRCDPADYEQALAAPGASKLSEPQRAARAEAAMLTAGLARHRTARPGGGWTGSRPAFQDADLFANAAWLLQVAKYMKTTLTDAENTSPRHLSEDGASER